MQEQVYLQSTLVHSKGDAPKAMPALCGTDDAPRQEEACYSVVWHLTWKANRSLLKRRTAHCSNGEG